MYLDVHVIYLLFLSDFKLPLFRFFKNTQTSNVMKIHSVGAELYHADKWDEAIAGMPENEDLPLIHTKDHLHLQG
jgi:hypothetical protein